MNNLVNILLKSFKELKSKHLSPYQKVRHALSPPLFHSPLNPSTKCELLLHTEHIKCLYTHACAHTHTHTHASPLAVVQAPWLCCQPRLLPNAKPGQWSQPNSTMVMITAAQSTG